MERELLGVEQARAVAIVQQEAQRLANRLDDSLASQHSTQVSQAVAAEQVRVCSLVLLY